VQSRKAERERTEVVELDDVGLHADPLEERLNLGIPDGGMTSSE
jgi:hypothetical protein